MQGPHAIWWVKAIEKQLGQLYKHKMWKLILTSKMKPSHQVFEKKWVYKIKQDVNSNVTRFKAR